MSKIKSEIFEKLDFLFSLATDYNDGTYFENLLITILYFFKSEEVYKNELVEYICTSIELRNNTAVEIIPFCMHELRWTEILYFCKEIYNEYALNHDFSMLSFLDSIIDSFNDEWNDIDLYEYYLK